MRRDPKDDFDRPSLPEGIRCEGMCFTDSILVPILAGVDWPAIKPPRVDAAICWV